MRDRRAPSRTIYKYTEAYESSLLRGDEDLRPWQVQEIIASALNPEDTMVDVGPGTANKTLQHAAAVRQLVGVEPNWRMLYKAQENGLAMGVTNFFLVGGRSEALPLVDNCVDVLTSIMSPPNAQEFSRVLRPGGIAIVENLGDRDKYNITVEFGADEIGLRGMFIDCAEGERLEYFDQEFSRWFSSVEIIEGRWGTYYTYDGLLMLLEQTPTVRNFDREMDGETLTLICEKYNTPRGVETWQHRILVKATK